MRAALFALRPGSRVLDAACGIGIDAAWLARRGFRVVAADASEAMVGQARRRLAAVPATETDRPGPAIEPVVVVRSAWTELPDHFALATFDAVLCTGNSIAHAPGRAEMVAAFEAFRSVLAPGGTLILDTHDWEAIYAAGDRLEVDPAVLTRPGAPRARRYRWRVPDRPDAPCVLEIGLEFSDGDRTSVRSYPVTLQGFTRDELRDRLAAAGFDRIALDAVPADDRYTAVARRPDDSSPGRVRTRSG